MKVFVDSNIFIAAITGEENRSEVAKDLLDADIEVYTSLLNIMEVRTVLSKKKGLDLTDISEVEESIKDSTEIVIPDSSDFINANKSHQESLLYPFDCMILELAEDQGLELVSFDSELVENGAVTPEDVLDR